MNNSLIDAMNRYGIGMNPLFFEQMREKPKFPPHNIVQIGEDRYRVTLAVAGYTRDDLKITLQGEKLTVSGNKEGFFEKDAPIGEWLVNSGGPDCKIHYRGIAFRNFTSDFLIGQNVRVDTVKLNNGLLDIDLIRQIPEAEKLKEISISV